MSREFVYTSDLRKAVADIPCQSTRIGVDNLVWKLPRHTTDELQPEPIIGVRWYSQSSEWMDCLVLTKGSFRDEVIDAIGKGVDEFFDDDNQQCYGDLIEWALQKAKIPYVIEYLDEEREAEKPYWEERVRRFESLGIYVTCVTS